MEVQGSLSPANTTYASAVESEEPKETFTAGDIDDGCSTDCSV